AFEFSGKLYTGGSEQAVSVPDDQQCVQLTGVHIRNRLQWGRQHQHWTLDEWRNVLFTDESRFSLTNDSRRTIIWRERGTRFHPTKIVEKRPFFGGGVLVQAGIMFNGCAYPHTRQEWKQLLAELLNHLIEGIPRRCDTCVAISNHTPY
ncbi:hypothetical protein ANN_12696, partial [Periplaneta americana]